MTREIEFRGQRIDNGEWVYGFLYQLPLPAGVGCMILTTDNTHEDNSIEPKYHLAFTLWVDLFPVKPYTVGEFTCMKDKHGNKVFEGDIVEYGRSLYVCEFVEGGFAFRDISDDRLTLNAILIEAEVIGNIHNNPELLSTK